MAHERTRREVLAAGPVGAYQPAFTPVEWGDLIGGGAISDLPRRLTLHVDDLACEIRYIGTPAHTTNDSIVWLPERSVLFASDLVFHASTPFVLMGSMSRSILALEKLRALGAETIVLGHGEPCGPEAIETMLGYLRFVQRTAAEAKAAELTPLQAGRETNPGAYAELLTRSESWAICTGPTTSWTAVSPAARWTSARPSPTC